MDTIIFVGKWLVSHHAASLFFGILSAGLWLASATVKIKLEKKVVEITYPNPKDNVNLHEFFATVKLQSKYNSLAALAAAATALSQLFGW